METLEGKEREKRTEAVFDKIVAENFSKPKKETCKDKS